MEVSARILTLELAETFVISRESSDTAESVVVEIAALRRLGLRGGGADRAVRRVGAVGARVRRGARRRARRRPVRARGRLRATAGARVRGARRARRCVPRPAGKAPRPAGVAPPRAPPRRAADELDGLARRSRRHGAPRGEGARPLPAPQAQARRPRRPRRRARSRRARRRRRPSAAGRRQRGVEPSTRRSIFSRSSPSSASRTASSRSPPATPAAPR